MLACLAVIILQSNLFNLAAAALKVSTHFIIYIYNYYKYCKLQLDAIL